jgi:F-type H+-transporting ATPase subunit delta
MKDRKLATRYARALIGALPDAGLQDRAGAFLDGLGDSIEGDAALRAFLFDPAVSTPKKVEALRAVVRVQGAPELLGSFLETVAAHGRLANLPSIAEVFRDERERSQGVVSATMTAAAPVPADLRARVQAALEKLSGKKVNLEIDVDPSLLGGAVSKIGSMVYDGSIKTQLARLRARLGEE